MRTCRPIGASGAWGGAARHVACGITTSARPPEGRRARRRRSPVAPGNKGEPYQLLHLTGRARRLYNLHRAPPRRQVGWVDRPPEAGVSNAGHEHGTAPPRLRPSWGRVAVTVAAAGAAAALAM